MKVVVKPYLFLREALGLKEITLDLTPGSTVHDLLNVLRQQYGLPDRIDSASGQLPLFDGDELIGLMVLIDGRNIRKLQGTSTALADGAEVTLFPPAAGG